MAIVDKEFCMSSFLAFRYITEPEKIFREGISHKEIDLLPDEEKISCDNINDIENGIKESLSKVDWSHTALMLSGGIDSAILASYMPKGTKAYTAICDVPNAVDETERAANYCKIRGLEHHIIKVTWNDYNECIDKLMLNDVCPVFANEPQVYTIAKAMIEDGAEKVIFGDSADAVFGGYDLLLSKDWTYNEWKERFSFVKPELVLKKPVDMDSVYRKYKIGDNGIDYLKFMDDIFSVSSSRAYTNAFECAGLDYLDPYAGLKMGTPLDLNRVRAGESKYLLRELFKTKYPRIKIPKKIAMARACDVWLKDWEGPKRKEFIPRCHIDKTGEQKFLIYSLERFLDLMEIPEYE